MKIIFSNFIIHKTPNITYEGISKVYDQDNINKFKTFINNSNNYTDNKPIFIHSIYILENLRNNSDLIFDIFNKEEILNIVSDILTKKLNIEINTRIDGLSITKPLKKLE